MRRLSRDNKKAAGVKPLVKLQKKKRRKKKKMHLDLDANAYILDI